MRGAIFKLISKLAIIFTLTLLAVLSSLAQKQEQDIFAPVPAETRARLIERLRLMMELESKDDRGGLYDMMFGPFTKKMTKEEFISLPPNCFTFKIVSFMPRQVDQKELDKVTGADWRIVGDTKIRKNDGSEQVKDGSVYAQFRNGEWYLTGVITIEIRLELKIIELKETLKPPV